MILEPCDASQSEKAVVMVFKGELVLLFCSHHFNRFEPTLLGAGWEVYLDLRTEELVTADAGSAPSIREDY